VGGDHDTDAIQQYALYTGAKVEECGVFQSEEFPYLATTPDAIIHFQNGKFGHNLIEVACEDGAFCLSSQMIKTTTFTNL